MRLLSELRNVFVYRVIPREPTAYQFPDIFEQEIHHPFDKSLVLTQLLFAFVVTELSRRSMCVVLGCRARSALALWLNEKCLEIAFSFRRYEIFPSEYPMCFTALLQKIDNLSRGMNFPCLSCALHARSCIDGISKELKSCPIPA